MSNNQIDRMASEAYRTWAAFLNVPTPWDALTRDERYAWGLAVQRAAQVDERAAIGTGGPVLATPVVITPEVF